MDIQAINKRAFSIYISGDELINRHIAPDSVTLEDARDILRLALGSDFGAARMDLFPGRDDVLIFVRKNVERPAFFQFQSFEDLLAAVSQCSPDDPSELVFCDGAYIFILWGWDGIPVAPVEFGELLNVHPDYILHLREHGRVLYDEYAVSNLREAFL